MITSTAKTGSLSHWKNDTMFTIEMASHILAIAFFDQRPLHQLPSESLEFEMYRELGVKMRRMLDQGSEALENLYGT